MSLAMVAIGCYALAVVAHLGLALQLLRRDARRLVRAPQTPAGRTLGLGLLCTAAWAAAALVAHLQASGAWLTAAFVLDVLRYGCWFVLLVQLLNPQRWLTWLALGSVVLVLALPLWSAGVQLRLAPTLVLALPVLGMLLLEQLYRGAPKDLRWAVKPLCIGLACVFVYDLYLHSHGVLRGQADRHALVVRAAVHALAVPALWVALRRQRIGERTLQLSHTMALHSLTLLLVGAYLLLISGAGYYVQELGGDWGRALQGVLAVAALLGLAVVLGSGSMRARLRVFVAKHFFRYHYDYRAEWLRFTATLSAGPGNGEFGTQVVRGLADMVESPAGTLWIAAADGSGYVPMAHWNSRRDTGVPAAQAPDSPLVRFMRERDWIVDVPAWRADSATHGHMALPAWLARDSEAWVIVPLPVGEELIGFVVLSRPRTSLALNWEVRDLLKAAARQAGIFIARMRAAEALLEARKFEAFNRMSAFVVHDLKNIVTQLSLMMKNARRLQHNPEFQQDMLATVEHALEKMRQLMLQLREGEAPADGRLGVDLGAMARRLQQLARSRGRELEVELAQSVRARGHEERLERVVGHMVQNALEATPAEQRVWLRVERAVGQARITVGDQGCGMSADFVADGLFKPFNTTKPGGMGIGAYESAQYLRELGGSISVHSEPGRGTVVTMLIPLIETERSADAFLAGAA